MNNKKTVIWLLVGMLAGLSAALFSLLGSSGGITLPEGAIARVNERFIGREDYARAVAGVVADGGQTLSAAQRRRVLDRLIDEELLVQYGLDQGLARNDRRVRADLVSAVIEAKSVAAETRVISDAEVRAFYEQHEAYFKRPQQLRVAVLRLQDASQATALRKRWQAGASLEQMRANGGVTLLAHVPDALVPLSNLQQLIGASLTELAATLPAGQVSEVVQLNNQAHLLSVLERVDTTPALDEIQDAVKAEIRRRGAEASVREALDRMREELDVVIDEGQL